MFLLIIKHADSIPVSSLRKDDKLYHISSSVILGHDQRNCILSVIIDRRLMIQTLFKCHPRPQAEDPGGKSTNFNIQYMLEGRTYYVYILANQRNGTVYVGFTHSLLNRIDEHKNNKYCGFTQKYNVKRLVYFEIFNDPNTAILREKTIKHLYRKKKIELIEKNNPTWRDLYYNILRAYS